MSIAREADAGIENAELPPPQAIADIRSPGEISAWKLALYSLPSIPIAFLYLPVALLMPAFYASSLRVSLTSVGYFLLFSRGLDVVLDPMIGKWSDSTRSSIGRRKLWMIAGTPLLMLGAYILFIPPIAPDGWYLLVASFVIYAGGSTVGLPYSAWGTDIVETYQGRSSMAGYRAIAGIVGGVLAAAVPAITGHFGHGIDPFTMAIMGWMIIVLTPLTVLIAILTVKEAPAVTHTHIPWFSAITGLLKNGPFAILCGAYVLFSIGGSVVNATMIFYLNDYLKDPTIVGTSLFVLAITNVAAVAPWVWIGNRIGKHRAIAYSLFLSLLIFAVAVPLLRPGQGTLYVVLIAILGIITAGYTTLPLSIIGDVIDYDTLKHRQNRGGLYWGVWSFAQKVAPAFGIAISLQALKLVGFDPAGHNSPAALNALKYAYCYGCAPFLLAGGLLLLRFPIDAKRHRAIRRRLAAREKREALKRA